MRKIYNPLAVGALFLSLAGCAGEPTRKAQQPEAETYPAGEITLRGKPVSAAGTYGQSGGCIAAVLDVGNKYVLAVSPLDFAGDSTERNAEAVALIQSEIRDGDEEPLEMTGRYEENGKFLIKSLRANGYEVVFKKE
ncbi:MAG: hypothetical protein HY514_02480 [Candidatus Aenigmarchaeota archaeon]|nr:hypothetical protein [Candidatus Aenigmarchaeota archaeon]